MQLKFALFVAVALALPSPPCAAQDVADFYKGKQISIIVGFTPGGSSSLYAQALARHMGRYLPGNPTLIVQHVPGAGGLVAANNVYNTAPRDGTAFAITGRTVAIEPLLGNKNAKFDARQFNWIGTANVEYTTCALWHTAKVKTLQDALSIEAVVGGSGADATEVMFPKAANKLIGTKFKIVLGLSRLDRNPVGDGARRGGRVLRHRLDLPQAAQRRLAQGEKDQHPLPDVAREAPGTARRSRHHRPRQDAGRPQGVRIPVRAAGDGSAVLRAAGRAGRAGRARCATPLPAP